jgi:hypothetical protein
MAANIQREFETIDLGDERREERIRLLATRLAAAPGASVSAASRGWAEAMAGYRLARSAHVTFEKVMAPHWQATVERARLSEESLLLIQDTTELNFTTHKAMQGLGPLDCRQRRGFFLHHYLLVAEESAVALGICGGELITRRDSEHGKAKTRKQRPIEAKESMRWMRGYGEACELAARLPEQQVLMVADREADIYELYAEHHRLSLASTPRAELLVRAKFNRALKEGPLFTLAHAAPLLGTLEMDIPAQIQRKKTPIGPRSALRVARKKACLEVRVTRVKLPPPFRPKHKLPEVELTLITAVEQAPPEGQSPICWHLFTTLRVESFADAKRILQAYLRRWRIEELHRILKTGCRIEERCFSAAASLQALLGLYLVVAWRILYLRDLSRAAPDLPGSACFSEAEWKSVGLARRCPLERAPPLGELILMVAILGGYLARKKDRPPGAECIWRGMTKLRHYCEMAEALGALQ